MPPFTKKNMKKDPFDNIFYSVHIALLEHIFKAGAYASFLPCLLILGPPSNFGFQGVVPSYQDKLNKEYTPLKGV